VVSGSVFKEIAEKVYATDIEMARSKDKLEKLNMPASKNGSLDDLNFVFKALSVPLEHKNGDSKWITTVAQKDKVELNKKSIEGVPNTLGMGLKDALFLLENKGFSVRVNGRGVVKSQTPLTGSKKVIILNLG